jgi:poly-gamma-glutamate capsule biosynthesis protein CapA/YwtB (metallophosphatase superfamily)
LCLAPEGALKKFICCWLLSWVLPVLANTDTVQVVITGDIMLDGLPEQAMRRGKDPFAGFAKVFQGADIRIGNLECVISAQGEAEPDKPNVFRVHPRAMRFVRRHFDAVGLANNHSGDYGPVAFADMLKRLKQAGVGVYGGGSDLQQAHEPWVIERKGVRIAVLGYNEFQPRSFEADHDKPGIAWSEDEQVLRDIARVRSQNRADVLIAVMHWGWEDPLANQRQRQLARLMIDAGVDAVIGGHPHLVQDTELYQGKPVFYSLGNFVFEGFDNPINNTGWVVKLRVNKQGVVDWSVQEAFINAQGLPQTVKPQGWKP